MFSIIGALILGSTIAIAFGSKGRNSRGQSGLVMMDSIRSRGDSGLLGASVSTDQIDRRLTDASATMGGEVEVSLAWNGYTDLDLHVRTRGNIIYQTTSAIGPESLADGAQPIPICRFALQ